MTSPTLTEFEALVETVYASRCSLVLSKDRRTALLKGNASSALTREVSKHNDELVQMLRGDPMSGFGWLGRNTLFKQAMKYVDRQAAKSKGDIGVERAVKAMCRSEVIDRMDIMWVESAGNIDHFRMGLTEYVDVGLQAASGKAPKMRFTAKGAT